MRARFLVVPGLLLWSFISQAADSMIAPLDCVFANPELRPLRMNARKNAGAKQMNFPRKHYAAGLLSGRALKVLLESPR